MVGAVRFVNGDVTNEWHYGPNLIAEPWFTDSWNDGARGSAKTVAAVLLKGPIFYSGSGSRNSPVGFFSFKNVSNYRFFNVNQWFDPFTNAKHDSQSMVLVYTDVARGAIQGDQITDLSREVPLPMEDKMGHIYYEPRNLHHVDV